MSDPAPKKIKKISVKVAAKPAAEEPAVVPEEKALEVTAAPEAQSAIPEESTVATPPEAEAPKEEAPKAEAPKAEAPKAEAPKAEAPKAEAPKAEAPKAEAPKPEPAKQELATKETPAEEKPKKAEKPLYKKWWFWVLAVIVVLCIWSIVKPDSTTTEETTTAVVADSTTATTETTTEETTTGENSEETTQQTGHDLQADKIADKIAEELNISRDQVTIHAYKDVKDGTIWVYRARVDDKAIYAGYDTKNKEIIWCDSQGNKQDELTKTDLYSDSDYPAISFDKLARTPDDYYLDQIRETGKVLQVVESSTSNTYTLRVAVNDDSDKTILVQYDSSIMDEHILEKDEVTVYGYYLGLKTYESTMSGDVTVPAIYAEKITIK